MVERDRSTPGTARVRPTTAWSPRRRAVTACATAVGLAIVAAALCRGADTSAPRPVEPTSREFLGFDPSRDAVASSTPTPTLQPALALPARARRIDGQVDLCGLGQVTTSADDPDGSAHISTAQRDDAAHRLLAALASAPDERAQAVERLLRLRLHDSSTERADDPDATNALADLAAAATRTNDPAVYASALAACGRLSTSEPTPAACMALAATHWASLEPTNAAPWLRIAQQARDAGDDDALAAAVYRVSLATRIDWHDDDLALAAFDALPADAQPLARTLDARAIAQARDGWAAPAYGGLAAFCAPGVDANRDQVCDASARLMSRPDASPYETRLGARMGRSLGWPQRRLEELRLQRDALARIDIDAPVDTNPYGCAAAGQLRQWIATRHRLGETGARRSLLASAGQGLDDAVARLRADRASRADRTARIDALHDEPIANTP